MLADVDEPRVQESESHAPVRCCQCGQSIESNPSNMCLACLRNEVDITEGIQKQGSLYFCRACERYLQPPAIWVSAKLESQELMHLCLKRIKGLDNKQVRLVDAGWIWTEEHSKRIKVKLTIQKEVLNGAIMQQVFVVEFVVHNQMCDDCHRVEAKDYWRAVVQVRQKTGHKKTLYYLEQLILKYKAHSKTTSIKQVHEGIDFYYSQKQDARKLVEFLQNFVPCRYETAQELVSHDIHSNIFNYKTTFSVQIVPICKDNVVCLPRALAQKKGNIAQVAVVYRVTQSVHLIDPSTCQIAEISGDDYWKTPFGSLCDVKQLQEYIVIDKELITQHVAGHEPRSTKHVLAGVWVSKASELASGENRQYYCRTHLGHLLSYGDGVLGFDLANANVNDRFQHFETIKHAENLPDVVLVKKFYADSGKRSRLRRWKLRRLERETEEGATSEDSAERKDYNDFLEDIEEDATFRQNINIYRDEGKQKKPALAVDTDDMEEGNDIPTITLAEMLEDKLQLEDDESNAGGDVKDVGMVEEKMDDV